MRSAQPLVKHASIPRVRISPAPFAHGCCQRFHDLIVRQTCGIHQGLRNRNGHNRVIRKLGISAKQRECLCLAASVKFIWRANHITKYSSDHCIALLSSDAAIITKAGKNEVVSRATEHLKQSIPESPVDLFLVFVPVKCVKLRENSLK